MKYYILSEDEQISNVVKLKAFPGKQQADFDTSYADKVREQTILQTVENENSIYPDVLLAPLYMVSKEIGDVIAMYDEEVLLKKVSLVNQKKATRKSYRVVLLDRIDCLHEDSEFYKDNSVKKLILDQEKIKGKQIFKVKGITPNWVIVSMNIAESILRRDYYGICLKEVEVR